MRVIAKFGYLIGLFGLVITYLNTYTDVLK